MVATEASPPPAGDVDVLVTERLRLRPLRAADAPSIHRLVNPWPVIRMLARVPYPYSLALTDDYIASAATLRADGRGYHFAITGEENGTEIIIGCVAMTLDLATRTGHLGYWVGQRYWGHGVAGEAAGRLVRWALANLPVDRIEAQVSVDNPASDAVLRRLGFRQTGKSMLHFLARDAETEVLVFEARREDIFGHVETVAPEPGSPEASAKPLLLVAACALIDSDTRILLARRPEGKKMAGLWEFPGGKLNPGETPEVALIRELREELGIDVTEACLAPFAFASHAYERFHLLMPLYLCRRWKGFVQPLEGQALAWVKPEKLSDYEMPAADKPLVPLLKGFL